MQTSCSLYKPSFHMPAPSSQEIFIRRLSLGCMILTMFFAFTQVVRDASSDRSAAYIASQDFVAERLLRPQSAKFPPISTQGVEVKYLGGQRYFISGYLESLNSFGNWQRSGYSCTVRYRGAGEWDYEKVTFE